MSVLILDTVLSLSDQSVWPVCLTTNWFDSAIFVFCVSIVSLKGTNWKVDKDKFPENKTTDSHNVNGKIFCKLPHCCLSNWFDNFLAYYRHKLTPSHKHVKMLFTWISQYKRIISIFCGGKERGKKKTFDLWGMFLFEESTSLGHSLVTRFHLATKLNQL